MVTEAQNDGFLDKDKRKEEIHCPECGKRLFDSYLTPGSEIEIVCTRRTCKLRQSGKKIKFRKV